VRGKTILVTGGTGSFGQAFVKRQLNTDIKEVRVFSRDERKQDEMRQRYNDSRIKFYIGDVRDQNSIVQPMQGVDYVFHASALKQVPSCESFPLEAVKTNVFGSDNVFRAAEEAGVEKVVALSTDKSVYPLSVMGASKFLMEKLAAARARTDSKTTIVTTRFGNLLVSSGSVVPLFIEQIKAGKPLTVTDPCMTRFFMTVEDAVDLVVYAFANGETGDILVKKSNAATIKTIAEALKEILSADNPVTVVGLRPGEKIHETLVTADEMTRTLDCDDYFRILPTGSCNFDDAAEYTSQNTHLMSTEEMVALLRKILCSHTLCS
jgi:UDP-glucose 4-epimerase